MTAGGSPGRPAGGHLPSVPASASADAPSPGSDHLDELERALPGLRNELATIERWGRQLARRLGRGGARLLVAGNGGSAAEAQHLTAELVGRFRHERRALSAIALHAETSTVTAVGNDYGFDAVFSRQVEAHGRPGDHLLLLSTSGRSPNLVAAAEAGRRHCLTVWALTGPAPNPLAEAADAAVALDADPATVQELHLVAVHLLCAAVDRALREEGAA
jgi:D-sedoheptulose 7-phosphate isomerase